MATSSSLTRGVAARHGDLFTTAVLGLGTTFFLLAAAKTLTAHVVAIHRQSRHPSQPPPTRTENSSPSTPTPTPTPGKTTDQSTVQVTYPTTWDMCDAGSHPDLPSTQPAPAPAPAPARHKVRAGALLKLIDVVAGVTARKHSEMSCVTVSVDSVLLLKPIYLGDLVHLSASVNRVWGSSLEVGVRVVKEHPKTSEREYVSHSYLTFVAISRGGPTFSGQQPPPRVRLASRNSASPSSSSSSRLYSALSWLKRPLSTHPSPPPAPAKPKLQPIIPKTPLEARRHILAGRRRSKRIDNAKRGEARDGVSTEVKTRVKHEVLHIASLGGKNKAQDDRYNRRGRLCIQQADLDLGADLTADQDSSSSSRRTKQDIELEALELEFVVEAYLSNDPAVTVDQQAGLVLLNLPGDVPLRHSLVVVERLAQQLREHKKDDSHLEPVFEQCDGLASPTAEGVRVMVSGAGAGPFGLAQRRMSVFSPPTAQHGADTPPVIRPPSQLTLTPIDVSRTAARTLHLVFPEHTNSLAVLFGGQLMDWMEEAALLSVRHVGRGRRWSTVGLDGLEFEQAVGIGEVMTFTAVVVRTFVQSCEVYVLAEAEAPNGTRRTTNDALLTLAFPLEPHEQPDGEERPQMLRQVRMPASSALETFAQVAPERRKGRLELKQMLLRVYA